MECMVCPPSQVSQYVNTFMHTTETIKVILMFDWWLTKLTKNNIVSVKLPVSRMVEVDLVMRPGATMSLPLDKINMRCFKSSVLHDPLKSWIIFWKSRKTSYMNDKWIWDISIWSSNHILIDSWYWVLKQKCSWTMTIWFEREEMIFVPAFNSYMYLNIYIYNSKSFCAFA